MSHQRIPAGLIVARRGVVCRISQWIGPPPVHCAACTANNRRGWREGETPVVSFTTRVSTSTRVRHADTGRVQTGTEREIRREEERERERERGCTETYHLWTPICGSWRMSGPRGCGSGNSRTKPRQGGSILFYARSCFLLHSAPPNLPADRESDLLFILPGFALTSSAKSQRDRCHVRRDSFVDSDASSAIWLSMIPLILLE